MAGNFHAIPGKCDCEWASIDQSWKLPVWFGTGNDSKKTGDGGKLFVCL